MRLNDIDAATAARLNEYSMDDFKTAAKSIGNKVKDSALATAGSVVGQGGEAAGRVATRHMANQMMQGWLKYKGSSGKPATAANLSAFLSSTIQRHVGKDILSDAQLQALVSGTPANQVPASSQQQGQQAQQQQAPNGGSGGSWNQGGGGNPSGQQQQQQQPVGQPVGGSGGQPVGQPQQAPGRRPASSKPVQPVNPGPTGQPNVAPMTYKQSQQQKANGAATANNVAPMTYKQSQQGAGANPTGQPNVAPMTYKQSQQQNANAGATASNVAPQKFSSQNAATPATATAGATPDTTTDGAAPAKFSSTKPPAPSMTNAGAVQVGGATKNAASRAGSAPTHVWHSKDHDFPVTPTGKEDRASAGGAVYAEVFGPDGTLSWVPQAELSSAGQSKPAAQNGTTPATTQIG